MPKGKVARKVETTALHQMSRRRDLHRALGHSAIMEFIHRRQVIHRRQGVKLQILPAGLDQNLPAGLKDCRDLPNDMARMLSCRSIRDLSLLLRAVRLARSYTLAARTSWFMLGAFQKETSSGSMRDTAELSGHVL